MKIGITERGDAGLDFSWINKIDSVDAAILITKSLSDEFINKVLPYKNKIILHITCTGYGSSILEPNVNPADFIISKIYNIIKYGFPKEQIVLRIDPIIPTEIGINTFKNVIGLMPKEIKRVRISVLDMYPHVRERFLKSNLPDPYKGNFQANDTQFKLLDNTILKILEENPIEVESCAEPKLNNTIKIGCISKKDLDILKLKQDKNYPVSQQRKECLCLGCKIELLENKTQCPNKCLYCYWKSL